MTPENLDLQSDLTANDTQSSTPAQPGKVSIFSASGKIPFKLRDWILIGAAILITAVTVGGLLAQRARNGSKVQQNSDIKVQNTSLQGFQLSTTKNGASKNQVKINGQLQTSDSLVVGPTDQPTNATLGQIYFDKNTNQLMYYNGAAFVALTEAQATVASLGGLQGVIGIGGGLQATGGVLSNSGVTSFQGQTGAVTLNAGAGIGITGTTIRNNGVLNVSAGDGTVSVTNDGAGNVTITASGTGGDITSVVAGDGITGGGTTGDVNVAVDTTVARLSSAGDGQIFTGNGQIFQNSSNSTTAFQIQNAAGNSNLLVADTTNTRIGIGTNTPGYTLDVNGDINIAGSNVLRIGGAVICNSGGCLGGSGSGNFINNSNGLQASANFAIQSANASFIGGLIKGAVSQTADLFQLQDSSANVLFDVSASGAAAFQNNANSTAALSVKNSSGVSVMRVDTTGSQVVFGTASSLSGKVSVASATGGIISLVPVSTASNFTLTLPAETGTLCSTGSVCMGYAPASSSGNYVELAPSSAQTDATTGSSIFINKTNGTGNLVQLRTSGNDAFIITNAGNIQSAAAATFQAANSLTLGQASAATGSTKFFNASGSGSVTLQAANPGSSAFTLNLPAETGTLCSTGSVCTGYAPSSGSGNYIQNQTSLQASSNFHISGTGVADTALQAPTIDVASAGALSIGTTTATSVTVGNSSGSSSLTLQAGTGTINIGTTASARSTNIATGAANQTVTVGSTSGSSSLSLQAGTGTINIGTSNSARSINIGTNSGSAQTVTIGSTNSGSSLILQSGFGGIQANVTVLLNNGNSATFGVAGSTTGGAIFNNIGGSGSIRLQAANPGASSFTLTLPAETGTLCSTASVCSGYAAASGSGNYVQLAPSSAQTDATTNPSIFINKTGGASTDKVLELQAGAGVDILSINRAGKVVVTPAGTNGTITMQGGNSGQTMFNIDGVGSSVTAFTITQAGTPSVTITVDGHTTIGNDITQTGSSAFSTGTGAVSLNGNVTVASGKTLSVQGTALFKPSSNSVTAFQVQPAASTTPVLNVDTTNSRVGIGTATPGAALEVSGNILLSQGADRTISVGTSAGAANTLTISSGTGASGAGAALNLQGSNAVSGVTNGGNVNITGGSGSGIGGAGGAVVLTGGNLGSVGQATLTVGGSTFFGPSSIVASGSSFNYTNPNANQIFSVASDGTNLILNPGFAQSPLATPGWSARGGGASIAYYNTLASNVFEGTADLRAITSTATNEGANITSFTGTVAAGTYTFSFYMKQDSGTPITTLRAGYNQGSGDTACTLNSNTLSTSGFQRYSCTFTTTANLSSLFVDKGSNSTALTFYIDAAELQSGSTAFAYNGGGVIHLEGPLASPLSLQNQSNSTTAFQIQNAAGTTLFNVDTLNSTVQLGSDITLAEGANRTIKVADRTTSGAGYNLSVTAGKSFSSGAGGALLLTGGANGGNSGLGGDVTITGGTSGSLSGDGGSVNINGGQGLASGFSGSINIGTTRAEAVNIQADNNINIGTTSGLITIGRTNLSALSIQAGTALNIGSGGVAGTVQIGNTSGAVTQTINIGNNATASSTNNVTIGSTIAGTVALQGATTITNRTSGSADTLVIGNSTSTGNIAVFKDNSTTVFSLADGGAALFKNQTDSSAGFQVQTSGGAALLTVNTTSARVEVTELLVTTKLTVNGHIISGNSSGTTTPTAGAAACTSPTVSVTGNDTSGLISITAGTSCSGGGTLVTINFGSAYGNAPRIVLTPADTNAAGLQYYSGTTTINNFTLDTNTTPVTGTTYTYNYFAIQ